MIARTAANDAAAVVPDPKARKRVENELARKEGYVASGDAKRAAGQLTKAIDDHRRAWSHAQQPLRPDVAVDVD
ncbi:MAG: hypothetical protein FJZ92_06750 [Chloroflexi bacterium]|nr:hypothetical protein [Chloroflexota bacterium]